MCTDLLLVKNLVCSTQIEMFNILFCKRGINKVWPLLAQRWQRPCFVEKELEKDSWKNI